MSYKSQGRTFIDSNGLALEYTASSFEFNANCEGDVYINIELADLNAETKERGIYFTVYVDGVKQDRICAYGSGNHSLKIASDLKLGDHTFAIYRQTEIEHGTVYIKSVTLDGKIADAPKDKDLLVQVIGASSVAGYGNLGNTSTDSAIAGYPIYEDGTQSFAFLLAQKLGADLEVIAQQGIGVEYGWRNANMQTVYDYRNYQHDTQTTFDFANARKPDIVVISLGGNDISCLGSGGLGKDLPKDETSYSAIQDGMEAFLTTLRSYYPNAKIVWEIGVVASSSNEKGAEIIKNAVTAVGGENAGFYFVDLREEGITNTSGAKNHPSAAEHAAFADAMDAYITNKGLVD